MLRAPGDDELVGVPARETDGVAEHVAPQSARGRDEHGVVLARLDSPEGYYLVGAHLLELVEHVVVEHQQHGLVVRVVLQAKEALAGVVGLHVVHLVARDEAFVLLTVGREGHAAVEEHLQVGPHLLQVLLAAQFHHP